MNKRICIILFIYIIFCGCRMKKVYTDVNCFKEVNLIIKKELLKNVENDSIIDNINIVINFYLNKKGNVDSITFPKNNLMDYNIDSSLIIKRLLKNKNNCIKNVYYYNNRYPDFITVIFNPKLIE